MSTSGDSKRGSAHGKMTEPSPRSRDIRRYVKFRGAGRSERFDRKFAVTQANAGKPKKKKRSEKVRSRWRQDLKRDEDIFLFINRILRKSQPVQLTKTVRHTVRAAKRILEDARPSRTIPPVGLPHWDHAAPRLKMLGWGMASWDINATPFTLRLSDDVVRAASKDARGFARHIQDRIRRHLKYRTGMDPAFWFAVEKGPLDEPHLHGAVVVPGGQSKAVRKAMRAAGGKWTSKARQFHFSPRHGAIGWVGYTTKWMYGSMRRVGSDRLIGASHPIRQAARRWFLTARRTRRVVYPI
jgi:hypothetical protein